MVGKQLKINLPRTEVPRFRRIYAYIGKAQTTDSEGALTPLCFQVIAKLNFRYGDSDAEYADSFIWARVQAYSSLAALNQGIKPWEIGDTVCGIAERTSKEMNTCQLVGWDILPDFND